MAIDFHHNTYHERLKDEKQDSRWATLYDKLRADGLDMKSAAYGASAVVFGVAIAALLFTT